MVNTPDWKAATVGYPGRAGSANQLLGTHRSDFLYTGTLKSSQGTGTAVYQSTQSTYISQTFTTASDQTAIGSIGLQLSTVGGSPTLPLINPISISVYATLGNLPTGSALGGIVVSNNVVYSAPFWFVFPMLITGLSPSTKYAIVTGSVGNASHYYTWQHSNQTSGCWTSPNGSTWTPQTFGLMYQIYDTSVSSSSSLPLFLYDDDGARLVQFTYNANGTLASLSEQTIAQDGTYLISSRVLSYTNGLITGVS